MKRAKARRLLFIAVVNLGVTLSLLIVTELLCRYAEQVRIDRRYPEKSRKLPPKSPAELRVFVFGGSTAYGVPVPEVGFVAQMQYWLQRLHPDRNMRVYNFGWPGADTEQVLRELTRRLNDQPDLMIVITGHNEFLGPGPQGRIAEIREMLYSRFATMRVLQWVVGRMKKSRSEYVMPAQVVPWDRESASFKNRIALFEKSVNFIVAGARRRGVKLILGTLPSNISDWPPVYKRLRGRDHRYMDTLSRIQDLLRDGKYPEASDAVNTGLSLYGEDAMLYFLRGRIQSAMGTYSDARESFVKARDLDPLPTRTSSQLNSIIRRVASGVAGVYLMDLETVYEKHSKNGLPGFDLIADNVHGTPAGESVSAQTIMQTMADIGFLPPSRNAEDECCPVHTFLADVGYLEPKSPLRLRVLLDDATYAMKTPFLNYEASRMYLREAMKVDDNSWVVWANLASLSYLTGDNVAGAEELRRATELHQAPLNINDRERTPYLKEALEHSAGR